MHTHHTAHAKGVGYTTRLHQINISGAPVLIENSNQAHGIGPPRGQPFDPDGWCGANFFRVDGDIGPDFNSIIGRLRDLQQYSNYPPISRPGCWAYPDMMEVGECKVQPLSRGCIIARTPIRKSRKVSS